MTQNCKSLRDRDPALLQKIQGDREFMRVSLTPKGKQVTLYEKKLTSRHPNPGAKIEKDYDFNLYHTKANHVFFYRDTPNRDGTPTKIKRPQSQTGRQQQYSGFPDKRIKEMLNAPNIPLSQNLKKTILDQLLHEKLPPLPLVSSPRIKSHTSGQKRHIINDYHTLETNSGYARNAYGGFYLH